MYTSLISVDDLSALLDAQPPSDVLVLDCGFELTDPQKGRRQYDKGHIAGARYVHLDEVLSGRKTGANGRHPLPDQAGFANAMAALGVNPTTQVVAYDNAGGMYASRLWWLLRWCGHRAVAVLDGGIAAWAAAGHATTPATSPSRARGTLVANAQMQPTVSRAQLMAALKAGDVVLLDARAPDRYRGENETLDAKGGHIPGARNRYFRDNLGPDGRFLPAELLRDAFLSLLGGRAPAAVVSQCGSGVTACHNLLAMEIAGLSGASLYPGSWSEWSSLAGSPVATGPEPGHIA